MAKENVIYLRFEKSDDRLAGNPYGKKIFRDQVSNFIKYDQKNIIVFPDQIRWVASSFVQGFFSEVVEKIGYANFDSIIQIKARNSEVAQNIRKDLLV